mmetsp:Transcript_7828/g.19417  ORF Transcript_7828/g.19417 Transcript_7828/m.19417 type:complete len:118 (+) Transcript_7828:69-422(+)
MQGPGAMIIHLSTLMMLSGASGWGLPSNGEAQLGNKSVITDQAHGARDGHRLLGFSCDHGCDFSYSCNGCCDNSCDDSCDGWPFQTSCDSGCDSQCDCPPCDHAGGCDESCDGKFFG